MDDDDDVYDDDVILPVKRCRQRPVLDRLPDESEKLVEVR